MYIVQPIFLPLLRPDKCHNYLTLVVGNSSLSESLHILATFVEFSRY